MRRINSKLDGEQLKIRDNVRCHQKDLDLAIPFHRFWCRKENFHTNGFFVLDRNIEEVQVFHEADYISILEDMSLYFSQDLTGISDPFGAVFNNRVAVDTSDEVRTRWMSHHLVFNNDSIVNGRPEWGNKFQSLRREFSSIMKALTRPDFLTPGYAFNISDLRPTLLQSLPEPPEILFQFEHDRNLPGQLNHRDFDVSQYHDLLDKTHPGLVVIWGLETSRIRIYSGTHRVVQMQSTGEWEVIHGHFIELTLHEADVLVMHGYLMHSGCSYSKINFRHEN